MAAQRPTVSRDLERLARRDSVVAVWAFGRPGVTLDRVALAVETAGGRIRRRSTWLHAVSADVPTGALRLLRRRAELRHLQLVARFARAPMSRTQRPSRPPPTPILAPGRAPSIPPGYGASSLPFRALDLFPLATRNVRGQGVIIALLDTGFETGHRAFAQAIVLDQYDFVFNDAVVRDEPQDTLQGGTQSGFPDYASRHGTQVWSLLAAQIPDTIIGVAPDAMYLLYKTEDVRSETPVEEDNFVAALERADSAGADIVSASLGYSSFYTQGDLNGDVAVSTVAADMAAQRGMVVVIAAGNRGLGGFRTIDPPSDGDSVIAVGAEDSLGTVSVFSSRGPTADGRLKPDLMAPGQGVYTVDVDPSSSTGFTPANGTSFATPLIAGTAALIVQLHPTLGPVTVLEALRSTGSNRLAPDSTTGWGTPDGAASAFFARGIPIVSPVDTLLSDVTPTFMWTTPELPALAQPVTFRVRVGRDSSLVSALLDTVVTTPALRLLQPQRPGQRLIVRVTGIAQDSVRFVGPVSRPYTAPRWATLVAPDDPAGLAVREVRPTFVWSSPSVAQPPGPFTFDLTVTREYDQSVALTASGITDTTYQPTEDLERNTPYRWRVLSHLDRDTATTESAGAFIIVDDSAPAVTLLYQNFPNPFPNSTTGRAATCIWFDLAHGGTVHLDILDIQGHLVRSLIPSTAVSGDLPAARYGRPQVGIPGQCDAALSWDGTARDGSFVPQGIYLVRLETPDGTFFKRIVFLGPGA